MAQALAVSRAVVSDGLEPLDEAGALSERGEGGPDTAGTSGHGAQEHGPVGTGELGATSSGPGPEPDGGERREETVPTLLARPILPTKSASDTAAGASPKAVENHAPVVAVPYDPAAAGPDGSGPTRLNLARPSKLSPSFQRPLPYRSTARPGGPRPVASRRRPRSGTRSP